jgi:hypothetical protein
MARVRIMYSPPPVVVIRPLDGPMVRISTAPPAQVKVMTAGIPGPPGPPPPDPGDIAAIFNAA